MKKVLILVLLSMPLLWACNNKSNTNSTEDVINVFEENSRSLISDQDATPAPIVEDADDQDKSPQNALLGSWTTMETVSGETLVFNADNTYISYSAGNESNGAWSIEGEELKLDERAMPYEIKDDQLILDGTTYEKS